MFKIIRRLFSHPPRTGRKTARRHNDTKIYNYGPPNYKIKTNEDSHTVPRTKYPGESPQAYDVIFEGIEPVKEEIKKPITEIMGEQRKEEISQRKSKRIKFNKLEDF